MRIARPLSLLLAAALAASVTGPRPAAAVARLPRLALWMEPGANLTVLSTLAGVRSALDRARAAGIDTVMPEAKNAWGYVIYPSAFAPTIDTSPVSYTHLTLPTILRV